ncbi:ATP-dependent protease La [Metamycoplasma arthritidis]|uniref:Lon protease n=1 Tax=Metamycoplasma arthritidis (strain 158L3-1) TaxID=243272 RepID=LON_META1|nr:endopeptidase La [Metamycoplasma arthritidis]B3PN08.1 RecName: Full=Lon protease; AltName: Full=ATP-dependent protease La [Metamycoplasma arthritidis 158L3-1]ACF07410.1 heat shock ATP-dependent protease [Metamycoplasma arthritidis 158L3-1]VEU78932.1 ATP-dependent protease La [Metamycoplasma arthritidis]
MKKLPYIAIRNQLIAPYSTATVKIGRPNSLAAIQFAQTGFNGEIYIFYTKDNKMVDSIKKTSDLEEYGVKAKIKEIVEQGKLQNVVFEVEELVKVKEIYKELGKYSFTSDIFASVTEVEYSGNFDILSDYRSKAKMLIEKLSNLHDEIGSYIYGGRRGIKELEKAFSANTNISPLTHDSFNVDIWKIIDALTIEHSWKEYFAIINETNLEKNYELAINMLINAIKMGKLDEEVNSTMRGDLENQQRDFLLRERLRQIKKLLKDDEAGAKAIENMEDAEENARQYPDYVIEALKTEQNRLASMMPASPEANISKTYIDLITTLPWKKVSGELLDIDNVRKILDKHHYGLEKPKERILEFISVLTYTKKENEKNEYVPVKGEENRFIDKNLFVNKTGNFLKDRVNNIPILTLIGPPGTGKTTLAKSIAEALGRQFVKISLGGVKDESEIRGHRRTYVGALPGKIISGIKKAGVSNPVILLDEIDKMSSDFRGDPLSALLEVLDPEQNTNFQDHYLDLEYDLSKVLFIATANSFDSIPAPLYDRVEFLELSTYTLIEKTRIARTHLLSKILSLNALTEKQYQITDEVLAYIIKNYTRESGVRNLQRLLDSIARKIVVRILDKKVDKEFVIDKAIVREFLGPELYNEKGDETQPKAGVVNALAYTAYGGTSMTIEVTTFPTTAKGALNLTGQLKDVMRESATISLAYVRSNAEKFGIKDFDFENTSIHIHVPEGAIQKDGPSAGVTFTTAIISALSKKAVPNTIAMTGEITLRGKVLPIGGLKEKSLAASQIGIKTIFIPKDNEKNLIDVPEEVKKDIKFVPVEYYDEIFKYIFEAKNK